MIWLQAEALEAGRPFELRDRWLNPPSGWSRWTTPCRAIRSGRSRSEDAAKALRKRTLTNLYNARAPWLTDAHEALTRPWPPRTVGL